MDSAVPQPVKNIAGGTRRREVQVTLQAIRRFAQAIGDTNPLYHDEAYAATTAYGGVVAPPLFCQTLTYDDVSADQLAPDGSPIELSVPVPAERVVGGSSDYRIHRLVRPGDVITITSQFKGVTTKEGRSGTLYLVQVQTDFTDQLGRSVASEVATYIKR